MVNPAANAAVLEDADDAVDSNDAAVEIADVGSETRHELQWRNSKIPLVIRSTETPRANEPEMMNVFVVLPVKVTALR
jgi:hypothetical protein